MLYILYYILFIIYIIFYILYIIYYIKLYIIYCILYYILYFLYYIYYWKNDEKNGVHPPCTWEVLWISRLRRAVAQSAIGLRCLLHNEISVSNLSTFQFSLQSNHKQMPSIHPNSFRFVPWLDPPSSPWPWWRCSQVWWSFPALPVVGQNKWVWLLQALHFGAGWCMTSSRLAPNSDAFNLTSLSSPTIKLENRRSNSNTINEILAELVLISSSEFLLLPIPMQFSRLAAPVLRHSGCSLAIRNEYYLG